DGREVTAQNGELLIDACERNDAYIPRFCYHPRMNPVGMCRMCLVEVDTGRGPALQPSCMIPVAEQMVVDTTSEMVSKAQDGVLEFLLANHPLDCPVCDKGGECPLQDQTMAYGPGESRWVEEKRHYEKPIAISETVYLDRERCILCDRCTRFAKEVAGDPLIHFIDRGSNTEIATFPDEPFSSYFSGNTVQICPVGALTAKPYRFRARPWDLEEVESTCTSCSVGCRITVQSSRNQVLRYQGVDSDPVNWSWLCDKGRFGFEAVNDSERLTEPLMLGSDGTFGPIRWSDALNAAADALRSADPSAIAVIGGANLTNESQYAWAKLAKGILGTDHVDAQLGDGLAAEVVLGLPGATIDQVCAPGSTVLYIGPDPKEELSVLYIRLKHAADEDGVRIIELSPARSGLSPYTASSLQYRPADLPKLVAALLSGDLPEQGLAGIDEQEFAAATALLQAADLHLNVVIGRANLAESADCVAVAASAITQAIPGARFLTALRRSNVRGALEAGLSPGMLPGRVALADVDQVWTKLWGSVPADRGMDTTQILLAGASSKLDVLVLLGADPLADFADRSLARRGVAGARMVISLDRFLTSSTRQADLVLPVAGFAECEGTHTNLEGRVTTLHQKVTAPGTARTDWMIAAELALLLGSELGVERDAHELWDEFTAHSAVHSAVTTAALAQPEAADGLLLDLDPAPFVAPEAPHVAPQSSYSLRLVVNRNLYDQGTDIHHCESSAALAPVASVRLSPADAAPLGVDNGTKVTVSSPHGSITAQAIVDSGVPKGSAVVRHNLEGADPGVLVDAQDVVCEIRVEVS
ncbi:MAG: NADH-quinone oxidoreductase subunit NuoG, partial [Microthrixaceae bacterium]